MVGIKSLLLTCTHPIRKNPPWRDRCGSYPGAFYHVTCTGNERKNIFADDRDRSMFLDKVKTSLGIYQVRIHAYVLISMTFHMNVAG